ncbi:MAG: ABC transporter permease [Ignavibacteriaceae bacterium]
MLKNYLKIALRNIFKNKVYSLINIIGFSIGIAVCLLIFLYIQYELSYDKFNKNYRNIYRAVVYLNSGVNSFPMAVTPPALAASLKEIPGIKTTARISVENKNVVVRHNNISFNEDKFFFADSSFFNIFTIPVIEGDESTALKNPYAIVITESIAKKYFGNSDPIGKVLNINTFDNNHAYEVTGVIKDFPRNSHIHPNFLASFKTLELINPGMNSSKMLRWGMCSYYTYALASGSSDLKKLNEDLTKVIIEHIGKKNIEDWNYKFQHLSDIHLKSDLQLEAEKNSSISTLIMFSAIAVFILLLAVINFVSLSTAGYLDRVKEIALRKVVGAGRTQLIMQFMGETILLTLISTFVAVSITELILPLFNSLVDRNISLTAGEFGFILIGAIFTGILSGSYPAFYLSSFSPQAVFRKNETGMSKGLFRRILVSLQFTIVTVIIASTIITFKQMIFIKNKDLGYQKDQVIILPLRHEDLHSKYEILKNKFSSLSGVEAVSGSSGELGNTNFIGNISYAGNELFKIRFIAVDYNFLKTMNLKLISGRNFSPGIPSDSTDAIIINEAASKILSKMKLLDKPLEATYFRYHGMHSHIIGTVKNFNYRPIYYPVQPLVIYLSPGETEFMAIKLSPVKIANTIDGLKQAWKELAPQYPFDFSFLDKDIESKYRDDELFTNIIKISSYLAILIGCLGLFGLANYATRKKTKEIGIRKVLGASINQVVILLLKEFILLVVISGIAATPISYFIMNKWLENFSYHINVGIFPFLISVAISLTISILTVSYYAIKVATSNPVKSLRYE